MHCTYCRYLSNLSFDEQVQQHIQLLTQMSLVSSHNPKEKTLFGLVGLILICIYSLFVAPPCAVHLLF
jgi:hypothetical protein